MDFSNEHDLSFEQKMSGDKLVRILMNHGVDGWNGPDMLRIVRRFPRNGYPSDYEIECVAAEMLVAKQGREESEAEPERLSAEWHARECEGWAEHTLEADQAATAEGNSDSAKRASEACLDRAAKMRRLAEVEPLLRTLYKAANRALWVKSDSIERWENRDTCPKKSRSVDGADWIKLGKAIVAVGETLDRLDRAEVSDE